jgi:hypothetical protein
MQSWFKNITLLWRNVIANLIFTISRLARAQGTLHIASQYALAQLYDLCRVIAQLHGKFVQSFAF